MPRPLDTAAVQALIAERYTLSPPDLARLLAHLEPRAEGNPFFLGELLRALEDEAIVYPLDDGWALDDLAVVTLPTLLHQILDARFARLDEPSRRLLSLAAVIGQEVSLELWEEIAADEAGAMSETAELAIEARLLLELPGGAGVRFGHALIRHALYEGIPSARRRAWHRRVGEALAAGTSPEPDAVAYHFQQGGDTRAALWLTRAAVRAERSRAWRTAATRYAAAAQVTGLTIEERGWLHLHSARLLRFGDLPAALGQVVRAIELVDGHDRALVAHALFARGVLQCFGGAIRAGIASMEAAMTTLQQLPTLASAQPPLLAQAGVIFDAYDRRGTLALWLALVGRADEAVDMAEAALATHRAWSGPELAPQIDVYLGLGLARAAQGWPSKAQEAFARAREESRSSDNLPLFTIGIAWELTLLALPYRADEPAAHYQLVAATEEAAARSRNVAGGQSHRLVALPSLVLTGRWDEGAVLARIGWAAEGIYRAFAAPSLGILSRARGEPALAWQVVSDLLPEGPTTVPGDHFLATALELQCLATALALDVGDLPTARAWLDAGTRWCDWGGGIQGVAALQLLRARERRASGDPAAARTAADAALVRASTPRQPLLLLGAHRTLGALDIADDRLAAAVAHLDAALALADACNAPYERALTLLSLAALHRCEGRQAAASAALSEARALGLRLGAAPLLAQIAEQEEASADPPGPNPTRQDTGLAALSPREREVLRLIAAGHTNNVIAAQLSLSVRTIERHIANLYRKIGARGKADATAYAFRHDLV